jgi:hypothetical protein
MAGLFKKIFTTEAIMIPMRPINMKFPIEVRSFLVVHP